MSISLLLVILALVCFGIATFGLPTRVNLIAAGLFLWSLSTIVRAVVIASLCAMLVTGCSTNTGDPKKDTAGRVTNAVATEVFNAVLKAGIQYGTQALTGTNGQDAAKSIFENVAVIDAPSAISHIMQAYAGPQVAPIAQVAEDEFKRVNPLTQADRELVLNTIGAAVQQVANENFAK